MDKEKKLKESSTLDPIKASMVRERKLIKLDLSNGVRFEFPEDATVIKLGLPIKGSDEEFHTFDLLHNDNMDTFSNKLQLWALPSSFYFILDMKQKVSVKFLGSSFAGGLARLFAFEKIYGPDTVFYFIIFYFLIYHYNFFFFFEFFFFFISMYL